MRTDCTLFNSGLAATPRERENSLSHKGSFCPKPELSSDPKSPSGSFLPDLRELLCILVFFSQFDQAVVSLGNARGRGR